MTLQPSSSTVPGKTLKTLVTVGLLINWLMILGLVLFLLFIVVIFNDTGESYTYAIPFVLVGFSAVLLSAAGFLFLRYQWLAGKNYARGWLILLFLIANFNPLLYTPAYSILQGVSNGTSLPDLLLTQLPLACLSMGMWVLHATVVIQLIRTKVSPITPA